MTPGEMVVLLLLAVLYLATLLYIVVLVVFRPWLILRHERNQHQNLESAALEPRESSETATEEPGGVEEAPPDGAELLQRSWWRRYFVEVPPDTEKRSWWRRYFGF